MSSMFARLLVALRSMSRRPAAALVGVAVVIGAVGGFVLTRGGDSEDVFIPRGDSEETLALSDPAGSPHFALTSDFDPSSNQEKTVPEDLQEDSDEVLTVDSAEFVDSEGPYALVWKIENGDDTIDCVNCVMLDARLKKIIKSVVDAGLADDVTQIVGADPARTLAGDYSGNGWQVEFVVGNSAKGQQVGDQISNWFLENSVDQKVFSVMWQNRLYSSASCGNALIEVAPVELYPSAIPNTSAAKRDAALDRVMVASPTYAPVFENRDGAQFVSGWKATSC